jgi:hypothetical protein
MTSFTKDAPTASLAPSAIARLGEIAGPENVLTAPEDLIPYGFDGTAALKHGAACVVLPKTPAAVAEVMRSARSAGLPVVTRGNGTGLSGGSVPVEGGIYTISEMCFEANGWEAGNVAPGFFFEEIPQGLPGLEGRICWEAQRFDPIVDADEAEKRTAKRPRSRRKKSLTISTNRYPIVA